MHRKFNQLFSGLIILLLIASSQSLIAQGASDLKFNEILVLNESNFVDEYGQHNSWIEIVNSSYSTVNIGGCYLTDDKANPTKYWIPNDSPETMIPPRGFVLFFADNKPTRGIFHLNFVIDQGQTLYLFDTNGRSLIDELNIPMSQEVDISYARTHIDEEEWTKMTHTTPRSENDHSRKKSAGDQFVEHDPSGIGMVIVAMSVVFSALAILFLFYLFVGKRFTTRAKSKPQTAEAGAKPAKEEGQLSGEINAAIAMSLYLYQAELHDEENTVLTIKKVARTYSPWNSKIYTLRKNPRI
ncbi:OadG family transporter subunit [Mangrovibacterium sp.]|uniref:OadG family transporter subunit n=1 Tax=Mangrovibacterium sp. TaxID=1961364 RepID=UPI0035618BA7